jgi:hypothetical protein
MSASISIPLIAAVSTSASRNVFQAAGVMRWPSRSPRSTAPRGMRRCRHSGNRRKQWTVAVGAPHERTPIGNKPANRLPSRQVLRIASARAARCGSAAPLGGVVCEADRAVVDEAAEAIATLQALSRSTRRRDRARQAVTLLAQRFTIVIRERCFNGAI